MLACPVRRGFEGLVYYTVHYVQDDHKDKNNVESAIEFYSALLVSVLYVCMCVCHIV